MSDSFKIYRSSAGSGKTYALVRQFIGLSITGNGISFQSNYFRSILAITFTNKAASEMKERVLSFLADLKNGIGQYKKVSFFQDIKNDTSLSSEEIIFRSDQIFTEMLHSYTDLSISTIDKFVYRIVRTFAHDLNLSQSFDVEMDKDLIIQPVVALLINKVGEDEDLTNALVAFAKNKVSDGRSYQLEGDLSDFASHFFIERSEPYVESLKDVTIKDCLSIKEEESVKLKKFESKITDFSDTFLNFCLSNNISPSTFFHSAFYNYFKNLNLLDSAKMFPGKRLKDSMDEGKWYSKGKPQDETDAIDANLSFLSKLYDDTQAFLNKNFKEYLFQKLLVKNIYSIAVLNELKKEFVSYKKDNNLKHISEFNNAIAQIVREEPAPFIYERLGERYNHFLIDEFQDTSVTQWHNLLPLITNSLSEGKESLIVGDAKQSIYRFRGGEVEQFLQLPDDIYENEKIPNADELLRLIQSNAKEEKLEFNWRSDEEVVSFNNSFFTKVKEILNPHLQKIYHESEQTPRGGEGGFVSIDMFPDADYEDSKEEVMNRCFERIEKTRKLGYADRDITVLCRTKSHIRRVAEFLTNRGIKVISDEALLLSMSQNVNFILSVLSYLYNPKNQIEATFIVNFLHKNNKLESDLHFHLSSLTDSKYLRKFLEKLGIRFYPSELLKLPLYDLAEQIISIFKLERESIYLQFFLDVILKYSLKFNNDIIDFLDWWEDNKSKEAVVIPEDIDAVKLMTVHKSKGLEFPVVILPFNWSIGKKSDQLWVDAKGKIVNLQVALLDNSSTLENSDYSDARKKDHENAIMDDLNSLYVAMTRAKHQLHLLCSAPKKQKEVKMNKLSNLLDYYFENTQVEFPYSVGKLTSNKNKKEQPKDDSFKLDFHAVKNWRAKVQLKNSTVQLWDVDLERKEWGSLLHETLAGIFYPQDKDKVLENLVHKGLINNDLKEKLKAKVEDLIKDKKIRPFFSEDWQVITEREILNKSGETYIPDRVLFKEGRVQVVDYKTGSIAKKDSHTQQIKQYAFLLQEMGYRNIETFIIYTEEIQKVHQV